MSSWTVRSLSLKFFAECLGNLVIGNTGVISKELLIYKLFSWATQKSLLYYEQSINYEWRKFNICKKLMLHTDVLAV